MFADLRDNEFKLNPQAILVCGPFGEPYMSQFAGVAYSQTEFKMKAILVDGVVYIPDPAYSQKFRKSERDYANYPMIRATYPIPAYAIKPAC